MLIDTTTRNFLATRPGIKARWLFWITAKNRLTGLPETAGFWTGDDDAEFTVEGQTRAYFGAGGLLEIGDITYKAGTNIQMQSLSLAIVTPEIEQAIRTYDPRLAPAQLHLAIFHPDTNALVSITRAFSGFVDGAPINEGGGFDGETAVCEVTLASSARNGTRTLATKKSDASQRLRNPNDGGRRYTDVSGSVPVWWGESRGKGAGGGSGYTAPPGVTGPAGG